MSVSLYGSGQTVIQAVSVPVTNAFTSSSTSMVDITGMTASITPQSTTSKILVLVTMSISADTSSYQRAFRLVRGSTPVGIGTLGTTAPNYSFGVQMPNSNYVQNINYQYLDSPSTTSSTTYKIQIANQISGGTFSLNNSPTYLNGGTDTYYAAYASSITLLEISGS